MSNDYDPDEQPVDDSTPILMSAGSLREMEERIAALEAERDALRARAEKAEELLRAAIAGEEVSWDDLARIAQYWIGERKP